MQLVRDEHGEQIEKGDFSRVPELVAVLDGARATLGTRTDETLRLDAALGELRAALLRHEGPRVVAKTCVRLLTDLERAGRPAAAHIMPAPAGRRARPCGPVRALQPHHLRRRRRLADALVVGVPAGERALGHRLLSVRRAMAPCAPRPLPTLSASELAY